MKGRPAFWIISCQREPAEALLAQFAKSDQHASHNATFRVSIGAEIEEATSLENGEFSGVVLVVDGESLISNVIIECVRLAIATATERDDFIVLPWLKDIDTERFKALAAGGNKLAQLLIDAIQLGEKIETIIGVSEVLAQHIEIEMGALRDIKRFRDFNIYVSGKLGRFSDFLCSLIIFSVILFSNLYVNGFVKYNLYFREIFVIIAFSTFIISISKLHGAAGLLRLEHGPDDRLFLLESFVCLITIPVCILALSSLRLSLDIKTAVAGLALGVTLDAMARGGRRARFKGRPFATLPRALKYGNLLEFLYVLMPALVAKSGAPLFEPPHKRIFVSYARSSRWSNAVAAEVASTLQDLGAFVFLDRPSLRPGRLWKNQLSRAINDSNVFIVVLDQDSVSREWVAAEFVAAYMNKMISRNPEIFVIHPPKMEFLPDDTPGSQFFAEIMVRPSQPIPFWMRSKMATYDPETLVGMCKAIRNYPISGLTGFAANAALEFVLGAIIPFCGIVELLSIPIFILAIYKYDFLIGNTVLSFWLGGVCAFVGGFTFRTAVFRVFEDTRSANFHYREGALEAIFGATLFATSCIFLHSAQILDIFLACLSLISGIYCGNYYALCTRTWHQQDNRRKQDRP